MHKYLLLIVFFVVACCGKKGDPSPPVEKGSVPVSELRVQGSEFDLGTDERAGLMNRMVYTVKPNTKTK